MTDDLRYLTALKRRRAALSAKDDLLSFARLMMPKQDDHENPDKSEYQVAKHHGVIAAALEQVEQGKIKRLIINCPPRHGKTQLASMLFPAWYLGKHPDRSIIFATYNETFSWDIGRSCRTLLQDPIYSQIFPEVHLKTGAASVDRLELEQKGKMFFVGRGGSLTGRGASLILIDDPIKDRVEADSPTTREKLWSWYNQVLKTRLMTATGAILLIQCMTGDTPVLLADGSEKDLRDIRPGDKVATFKDGKLATSTVRNWKSNGLDCVFTIKTTSGITVKANERHPFLVSDNGVQKWIRTRDLRQGQEIFRVNGGSGKARLALGTAVRSQLNVAATATPTTIRSVGLTALDRLLSIRSHIVTGISNTVTALQSMTLIASLQSRAVYAPYVGNLLGKMFVHTGGANFALTTVTTQKKLEACYATTAISPLDMQKHQKQPLLSQNISDFILDEIVSIEPTGVEEVFDVQIDETENFIANGLVSHNTRWHEDDLCGRITDKMNPLYSTAEAKRWHIIDLPALAKEKDVLGRKEGEALWPERFPVPYLAEMREADPRGFQALFQGSPTPESGNFFPAEKIKTYSKPTDRPPNDQLRFYMSSDHAVSTKQDRDKTCVIPVGVDEHDNVWIMDDVFWERAPADVVVERMIDLFAKYKPMYHWAERGHISKSIGPFLRKRMIERQTYTAVEEIVPVQDKQTRAQSMRARIAMGKVYMPSYAKWYIEAHDQLLKFPYGAHDDFADALAYIGLGMAIMVKHHPAKAKQKGPAEGTMGWIKAQSRAQDNERKARYGGF